MSNLNTLLSEARARGKEPKLVEGLEKLIAELSLLTPYDATGQLQDRWGVRAERGRPWKEPGELDWMDIGGHLWATDGAIAFREDAPRPLWRRLGHDFEDFHGTGPSIRARLENEAPGEWPAPPSFCPRFAPLLRECTVVPHEAMTMGVCRRDGEIIALVMPLRRGCRGIGPDGLPVEAEQASVENQPEPPEEWTDEDARSLRRLVRKTRTDEVAGGVACTSAKEHRELFGLQRKQERCAQ